jgi:hypothetical protein
LFSLGETPFALVQPNEMIAHLEGGNRLDQPTLCPNEMYFSKQIEYFLINALHLDMN